MSQIAIYVPEEIQEKMDRLAGEEGKSRSQWVKDAILDKLATRHLTDQWFGVWGGLGGLAQYGRDPAGHRQRRP